MQTKNLIKIIKAEATVLESMIESLPDDGNINLFEARLLQNKIRDIETIASHLTDNDAEPAVEEPTIQPKVEPAVTFVPTPKEEVKPSANVQEEITDKDIQAEPTVQQSADEPVKTEAEPVKEEIVIEQTTSNQPKATAEEEKTSLADLFADNTVNVEQTYTEEATTEVTDNEEPAIELQPEPEKAEQKPNTLADTFQNNAPSINDVLAGLEKKSNLASKFNNRPITNLRKAIKINDRIRYINELFSHDSLQYEQTIDQIEQSANINDALAGIFNKYQWNQDDETAISFLELVYQRFKS